MLSQLEAKPQEGHTAYLCLLGMVTFPSTFWKWKPVPLSHPMVICTVIKALLTSLSQGSVEVEDGWINTLH